MILNVPLFSPVLTLSNFLAISWQKQVAFDE
jgi:hypothetical protein